MSAKHTIVINGKLYDAVTGMPVAKSTPATHATNVPSMDVARPTTPARTVAHHSSNVHNTASHSTTLRRGHLKTPASTVPTSAPTRHATGHTNRSPMIAHFAAHPQPLPKHGTNIVDESPQPAPVTRHHAMTDIAPRPTSKEVKEKLIAHASQRVSTTHQALEHSKPKRKTRKPLGRIHLVSASIALVLLGGYLTYINMPGISVSVAASQAGVAAKYPSYSPDGYSFEGPVAYEPGQVAINFKANGGGNGYTIEQRASTWNSVALLDNYVESTSKGNYETTSQNGVTVYTYGSNAAWTNGGVFYTITGEAPLNTDQLLHIVSSM